MSFCTIYDTHQNVKRPFPMPILFYMTSSGRQPVMEFLESLLVSDRKEVMADIVTLRLSYPAAPPLVKKIESGLWELRSRTQSGICRIFFTVDEGAIVLLHGFLKKTQKTPQKEIDTARKRLKSLR